VWIDPDFVAVLSQAVDPFELDEYVAMVPDIGDVDLMVVGSHALHEGGAVHHDVCVDRRLRDCCRR